MDLGDFQEIHADAIEQFLKAVAEDTNHQVGLACSFDGASRSNPGKAAEGNCMWWGTWQDSHFVEGVLLMNRGRRIGKQTNNIAEARSMAFAVKAALPFWFWLAETCAQATGSNMRKYL